VSSRRPRFDDSAPSALVSLASPAPTDPIEALISTLAPIRAKIRIPLGKCPVPSTPNPGLFSGILPA